MRFYILSPQEVPLNPCLFPAFMDAFKNKGHEFVSRIEDCNVVLFDLHSRLADYDQRDIDWIVSHKTNCAIYCEWDRGNLSFDIYPNPLTEQQEQIFELIHDGKIKSIHFCRLMDKMQTYKYNIHPFEKGVSYEEPMITPDELFDREYDIVFIANTSPSRQAIAKTLMEDRRLKCHISLGAKKIEFSDFVKEHKKGKLFISCGAGGFSNERKQCLFSIAGMIEERTNQVVISDLTHLQNCLMISSPPTKQNLDTIYKIVNDKEKLYNIYRKGYDFMKLYYTNTYIANNIIEKIEKYLQ